MKRLYKGYVVHSDGRVERKDGKGFYKLGKDRSGYVLFTVSEGRKTIERTRLHRIVWKAFNGKIPQGMEIDHIDEDRSNNALSNLRLLTKGQNLSRAKRVVTDKQMMDIKYLKSLGYRQVDIAEEVGISQPVVSRVLNGKEYEWNI